MPKIEVAAFYEFAPLPRFDALRAPIFEACTVQGVKGICLLAPEGVNGTLAGDPEGLAAAMCALRRITGLALPHKTSFADEIPFRNLRVRLKKEIVTLGEPLADPTRRVGTYVEPKDWNALIADPDLLLIDARNHFEVALGTFAGALDPGTKSFGQFPAFVRQNLARDKHKRVAMFCTGGIRCEKASALLLNEGFEQVYHLKGGILNYLETIPETESLWRGGCFVFDNRVALGHGLKIEPVKICAFCQSPLTADSIAAEGFEVGVSCPACVGSISEDWKRGARERVRQRRLEAVKARASSHEVDTGSWIR